MKRMITISLILILALVMGGCDRDKKPAQKSFLQIGEFTITKVNKDLTLVRDGSGRTLALVPREAPAPEGYEPHMIVRTPVKRVAAYGSFDIATLRVLGVLDETLVGVTNPIEKWFVDDVKQGMAAGKIVYLGNSNAIDFERLKKQPHLPLPRNYSQLVYLQ